jgi:hypothetical protein
VPTDIAEKAAEIRRLLKLSADQQKFVLTYSPMREKPGNFKQDLERKSDDIKVVIQFSEV